MGEHEGVRRAQGGRKRELSKGRPSNPTQSEQPGKQNAAVLHVGTRGEPGHVVCTSPLQSSDRRARPSSLAPHSHAEPDHAVLKSRLQKLLAKRQPTELRAAAVISRGRAHHTTSCAADSGAPSSSTFFKTLVMGSEVLDGNTQMPVRPRCAQVAPEGQPLERKQVSAQYILPELESCRTHLGLAFVPAGTSVGHVMPSHGGAQRSPPAPCTLASTSSGRHGGLS